MKSCWWPGVTWKDKCVWHVKHLRWKFKAAWKWCTSREYRSISRAREERCPIKDPNQWYARMSWEQEHGWSNYR